VHTCSALSKTKARLLGCLAGGVVASILPSAAGAATVANPLCPTETVLFDPGQGQDIVVPDGFKISVFASGLNFPTGIAFRKMGNGFEIYILESGHGLPSQCNDEGQFQTMFPGKPNPFTPDILVFDQHAVLQRTLGKPTTALTETGGTNVFQPHGPSVDIAFENGLQGGRLFATDSNQATHAHNGQNNSSRIVTVDAGTGKVTPFISGLPTGDHPTEQLAFKNGWIYWSQGSTTNSGVVGRDNGGGQNQPDIPCQDIVLSQNVFDSGGGVFTSGYSPFGTTNKGGTVQAFTGASHHGVCDGAILRAQLNAKDPSKTIEPFSWGYRNGYAIRFAPEDHVLKGGLLVGEDGADERGARPSNNAPDALHLAQQNKDGSPDYHGWPDRFGFLPSSQAVFNPIGGPGDDLPPAAVLAEDVPIKDVLDHPPQQITSPLALEAADSSFTGIDFVPDSFARGPVGRGAVLYALEGDFGFSAPNSGSDEIGHEVRVINFSKQGDALALKIQRFAKNKSGDQAFIDGSHGWNRPTQLRFGPDGCAWISDYGAVRDFGGGSTETKFVTPADAPLVQIPGTGVIYRICPK
jgi:glucose/arabinose dehydrogenase